MEALILIQLQHQPAVGMEALILIQLQHQTADGTSNSSSIKLLMVLACFHTCKTTSENVPVYICAPS
jgi:hypothetical protein